MNRTPDVELVLRAYFADDGLTAPDSILDVVEDRIAGQPRRRSWRLSWRPFMNPYLKVAAGIAAVLIVAVVGYNLLPSISGPGDNATTAPTLAVTPTNTPAPGATPRSTEVADLHEGLLADGRYRIDLSSIDPGLSIVANIPAGWFSLAGDVAITSPGGGNAGILIRFTEVVDGLFSDPCHWDRAGTMLYQPGDVEVGPTVDDLVAAFEANTWYPSSTPNPVTFGQFEGQELELQLPGNGVISTCDERPGESTGSYYVFPGGPEAQGPNSRWQLFIVDVDRTRLVIVVSIAEGTPQPERDAMEAVVGSFEIRPSALN